MKLYRLGPQFIGVLCLLRLALAAPPAGSLDLAGDGVFAGWARDNDYSGPIQVELRVDGALFHVGLAARYRPDVDSHAFHFVHPAFGPGSHQARAYALGVDANGQPDGARVELGSSPQYWSEPADREYWLTSSDGQVRVAFDKKFGGAITKIYDLANMGELCLIDWEQAGALFQPAFWLLPRHDQLPPGCSDTNDMWYDNPTLGGFVADGSQGNPIGVMGTAYDTPDPQEFIRHEGGGCTVHFKSRFIRYDYCLPGIGAPMSQIDLWDTYFYVEQWARFLPQAGRTLRLRSRITFVGSEPRSMSTRALPIIFAFHLPRVAYWQNGQMVVARYWGETPINPDESWAALIADTKEVGIGMVLPAEAMPMPGWARFNTGEMGTGQGGEPVSIIFPGGGVPDLRTFGILQNVELDPANPGFAFLFHPGGSFEWTIHYPIGDLDMIKATAEMLMQVTVPADFDYDGDVDQSDFAHLQNCFTGELVSITDSACCDADLDEEGDVDQDDLSKFQRCMSGPNSAPEPDCAN